MRGLLLCGAVCVAGMAGAGEWRVTRDIAGAAEKTTVVSVPLDAHVFGNSEPELADVRVLDQAGREVPRVIIPERDYAFEERHVQRQAKLASLEQLPDGGLSVVCEIERTNAVSITRLNVRTPLQNYEQKVTVYASDGQGAWRLIKGPEPLFDYSRFADVTKAFVDLPAINSRLFKLVIGQADDRVFSSYTSMTEETGEGKAVQRQFRRYEVERRPFRIDAVLFRDTERVAVAKEKCEPMAAKEVVVSADAEHKRTLLSVGAGRYPVVGLAFNPEQQNFERQLKVEVPAEGGWRLLDEGVISRSRLPGVTPCDNLELRFREVRAERLRVQIRNDDNPPLTFGAGAVTLLLQAYSAAFIAEKGERYRLVYGNPEISAAPVYEQGVTAYLRSGQRAATWRLSPAPEGAVSYGAAVQVRKFLGKHGMLIASAAVMAILGALILRAVRHVEKK